MHMAITLRDARHLTPRRGQDLLVLILGMAAGLSVPDQSAQAQAQEQVRATTTVTPTLSAQVTYSDNATQAAKDNRQSDTIVSVSPGVAVQYRNASSTLNGQMQLSTVNYLRNSQPDRLLPNGQLALHTEIPGQGLGLDANIFASQVRSQFTSPQAATANTSDSYTNTRVLLSPFLEKSLDDKTLLQMRLERTQIYTTANSDGLTARPETNSNAANLGLMRKPTRLGYALSASYRDNQVSGRSQSLNSQRIVKGTALYALTPEMELGLILGRESSQVLQQRNQGTVKGLQMDWRPSSRTQLKAMAEDRFFGRAWNAHFSHRRSTLSFGLQTSRQIDTNLASGSTAVTTAGTTQALLDAMLTSRIPNEAERAKAVNDLIAQRNLPQQLGSSRDLYDLNTLVRQNLTLQGAIMGQRSTVLLAAGQIRTRPLSGDAFSSLLGAGNDTRERYFDVQLNHRLSPVSTVTMGLRLSRARAINPLLSTVTSSRDQGLRLSVATTLSPRSQAVWGLRRLRTVGRIAGGEVTENVVFAGLEHRF